MPKRVNVSQTDTEYGVPCSRVIETGHGYVKDKTDGREGILLASSNAEKKDIHWLDEKEVTQ